VRGVAKDNPWGRRFHDAATQLWGELHPYTGYSEASPHLAGKQASGELNA